jgi:hypothetical protein
MKMAGEIGVVIAVSLLATRIGEWGEVVHRTGDLSQDLEEAKRKRNVFEEKYKQASFKGNKNGCVVSSRHLSDMGGLCRLLRGTVFGHIQTNSWYL